MFRKSNLNEIVSLIPNDLENLKEFIEENSRDVYYEMSNSLKIAAIDEVDFAGKQFAIMLNFENNRIELIDDIVNPDYYGIGQDEWDKTLSPLRKLAKKKEFSFVVDNVGNEDYLWASLVGPMSDFDESFIKEAVETWDNINKAIRRNSC